MKSYTNTRDVHTSEMIATFFDAVSGLKFFTGASLWKPQRIQRHHTLIKTKRQKPTDASLTEVGHQNGKVYRSEGRTLGSCCSFSVNNKLFFKKKSAYLKSTWTSNGIILISSIQRMQHYLCKLFWRGTKCLWRKSWWHYDFCTTHIFLFLLFYSFRCSRLTPRPRLVLRSCTHLCFFPSGLIKCLISYSSDSSSVMNVRFHAEMSHDNCTIPPWHIRASCCQSEDRPPILVLTRLASPASKTKELRVLVAFSLILFLTVWGCLRHLWRSGCLFLHGSSSKRTSKDERNHQADHRNPRFWTGVGVHAWLPGLPPRQSLSLFFAFHFLNFPPVFSNFLPCSLPSSNTNQLLVVFSYHSHHLHPLRCRQSVAHRQMRLRHIVATVTKPCLWIKREKTVKTGNAVGK